MLIRDRAEAGQILATKLKQYAKRPDVIILALPRGGVPVAYQVATILDLPLDIFLVRKLGVPGQEELAMGAIASGGVRVLNHDVIQALQIPESYIDSVAAKEQRELERREKFYKQNAPPFDLTNKTVILIDDGLATGATMRAAAEALKQQKVNKIVIAVPVAAESTCRELSQLVDEIVCALTPEPFYGVGYWYDDFSQTSDVEVIDLLKKIHHGATERIL
ncbi:phosphoribosyltransferase [bacterium]|nr:phosphoribosyltransferase [bacterium]